MQSYKYTIHVDRGPEQVWAYMMDFSKAPRWRNLVREVNVPTPGPLRAGSEQKITFDVLGKVRHAISEVWAFEPFAPMAPITLSYSLGTAYLAATPEIESIWW